LEADPACFRIAAALLMMYNLSTTSPSSTFLLYKRADDVRNILFMNTLFKGMFLDRAPEVLDWTAAAAVENRAAALVRWQVGIIRVNALFFLKC
jgi:hypothetical protein